MSGYTVCVSTEVAIHKLFSISQQLLYFNLMNSTFIRSIYFLKACVTLIIFTLTLYIFSCEPLHDFYDQEDSGVEQPDPLSVSDAKLWLLAEYGVENSSNVTIWTDQSGNGYQAVSFSNTSPTLLNDVMNGKPVFSFDGTNDYFTTSFQGMGGTELTFFIVTKGSEYQSIIRLQNAGFIIYPYSGNGISNGFVINNDGSITSNISHGIVAGSWNIGVARYIANATNGMQTFRNGSLVQERTSLNITLTNEPLFIGSFGGVAEFTNAYVAEIIIYGKALSTAERESVECYLSGRYGISVS